MKGSLKEAKLLRKRLILIQKPMARLTGDIKLEGTLGDVTFYKAEDRYLARMKAGVDRKRFKKDPAFLRSRACSRVFGQASRAARTFSIAFASLLEDFPCRRFNSAMTGALVKAFSANAGTSAGSGTHTEDINPDNLSSTTGFEFNRKALLGEVFQIPWQASINRDTGTAQISIPSFIPADGVVNNCGATHFSLHAALTAVDLRFGKHQTVRTHTGQIMFGPQQEKAIELRMAQTESGAGNLPLFLTLGVAFSRKALHQFFRVDGDIHNALQIIAVDAAE
jgi:hypothetical protein